MRLHTLEEPSACAPSFICTSDVCKVDLHSKVSVLLGRPLHFTHHVINIPHRFTPKTEKNILFTTQVLLHNLFLRAEAEKIGTGEEEGSLESIHNLPEKELDNIKTRDVRSSL